MPGHQGAAPRLPLLPSSSSKSQGCLLTNNPQRQQDGAPGHRSHENAHQETDCGSALARLCGRWWERLHGLGAAQTLVSSAVPEQFECRSQCWSPNPKLSLVLGRCLLHLCLLREVLQGPCSDAACTPGAVGTSPLSVAPPTSSDIALQHTQQLLVPQVL